MTTAGLAVGDLAFNQEEGNRSAKFIGQGMDLGGATAARSADHSVQFPFSSRRTAMGSHGRGIDEQMSR